MDSTFASGHSRTLDVPRRPISSRHWSLFLKTTSAVLFGTASIVGLAVGLGGPAAAPTVVPVASAQTTSAERAPTTPLNGHRFDASRQPDHRGGHR